MYGHINKLLKTSYVCCNNFAGFLQMKFATRNRLSFIFTCWQ